MRARAALLVSFSFALLAACSRNDEEGWFAPRPAPEIHGLAVVSGQPFDLRAHRGKVVLLSFGYTSCAEICPQTFSTMKAVQRELGDAMEFVYVTVDPERDRPAAFKDFMRSVDPRFEGIYAEGGDLAAMLSAYHVTVRKRLPEPGHENDYAMDHTSGFWGIDRRGALRFRLRHDASPNEIRDATKRLAEEPAS
jgi:protein SCO1/2